MYAWMDVSLVFIFGCMLGGMLATLVFRAKLSVYKRFIESRLDSLNLPIANRVFRSGQASHDRKEDSHHVPSGGAK